MRLTKIYSLLVVLSFGLFITIFMTWEKLRPVLIQEDRFIEDLTALLFFTAFSIGVFFLLRSVFRRVNKALIVLPCIALFGFLDEVSFGDRLFGLPEYKILGVKIDGIHDLIDVTVIFLLGLPRLEQIVWVMTISLILARLISLHRKRLKRAYQFLISGQLNHWFYSHSPLPFVILAIVYFCLASAIDVITAPNVAPQFQSDFLSLIEEILEMNVALSLLFANLTIPRQPSYLLKRNSLE